MSRLTSVAVALSACLISPYAHATLIASFSQNPSETPTIFATDNGTTTHITSTDASTTITTFGGSSVPDALFTLNATSIDAAQPIGAVGVLQHYSGTFCFTSAAGCGGTNYISGTFSDAAFGALNGPGLNVNVNNPPDQLTLTSSVIPSTDLGPPSTFNLSFADLTPVLAIDGATIRGFTADFAGNISATTETVNTPEPASMFVLGASLLGLGMIRMRNKQAT